MKNTSKKQAQKELAEQYGATVEPDPTGKTWWLISLNGYHIWSIATGWQAARQTARGAARYYGHEPTPTLKDALAYASWDRLAKTALDYKGDTRATPIPLPRVLCSSADGRMHVTTDGESYRSVYGLQAKEFTDPEQAFYDFYLSLVHAAPSEEADE